MSLPRVPDGTILRVLRNLLYLKEERLSYRSLEVEQIGSVYEAVMGYRVETATGRSVAIKPEKRHGAPVTIDLDELLATPANKRAERFKKLTDRKLATCLGRHGDPQCPHRGRSGRGPRSADRPPAHPGAGAAGSLGVPAQPRAASDRDRTTRPDRSRGRS